MIDFQKDYKFMLIFQSQDPGMFGDDVINASRDALNTRYLLLPYLYTLFHFAHTEGRTVVRSLVHEYVLLYFLVVSIIIKHVKGSSTKINV